MKLVDVSKMLGNLIAPWLAGMSTESFKPGQS